MARIITANLKKVVKERYQLHGIVHGSFSKFTDNGETYFQIDTYGSESRTNPGKCSQTIQIDRQSASNLIDLLKKELSL